EHDWWQFHASDKTDPATACQATGEHPDEIRGLVKPEHQWHHIACDTLTAGDREHGAGKLAGHAFSGLLKLEAMPEDEIVPLRRVTAQRLFLFARCARLDVRYLERQRIAQHLQAGIRASIPCRISNGAWRDQGDAHRVR